MKIGKSINQRRRDRNTFWAVYDKNWKIVAISKDKRTAQEEALRLSNYRWTIQTFRKDWGYLENNGHHILKSRIVPCCNCDRYKGEGCNFCY